MAEAQTTTKEALEREFDHFSIVPFKAICGADRVGQTTTQDPRRAKCPICWQYWNEWEASFYFNARVSALGVKRISGEQWLTERGFADSRTYSNTEIGKLLEEYARISAPIVAPEVDGISWSALLSVLERLKSKTRNPDAEWYHGWNAAIQCLINDINGRRRTAPASTVAPQQSDDAETLVKQWIGALQDGSHVTDEDAEDLVFRIIAHRPAPASPAALRDEAETTSAETCIEHCEWCDQDYDFFTRTIHCPHDNRPKPLFATTPPSTLARKAAEAIRDWLRTGDGEVDGNAINEVAAIVERHFAPLAADSDARQVIKE